jgi:hypothetical protein
MPERHLGGAAACGAMWRKGFVIQFVRCIGTAQRFQRQSDVTPDRRREELDAYVPVDRQTDPR